MIITLPDVGTETKIIKLSKIKQTKTKGLSNWLGIQKYIK